MQIALASPPSYMKCVLYADSKAAIQAINKPDKQSGQGILISAIKCIEALIDERHMHIEIKWVLEYKGIAANKQTEQRKTLQRPREPTATSPHLTTSY